MPSYVTIYVTVYVNIYAGYNLMLVFSLKFRLSICAMSFLLFCNKGPLSKSLEIRAVLFPKRIYENENSKGTFISLLFVIHLCMISLN